jgi:pimeloyl-ACP methyl ester carboxylesterase
MPSPHTSLQLALAFALVASQASQAQSPDKRLPMPGETFTVEDRPAFLIRPERASHAADSPAPWIWYAPTLPAYPAAEEGWMFEQLLAAGIAIAGIDVGESYGSPDGSALFSAFHKHLTEEYHMAPRPALLARSRGGLMLYSWAAANPAAVAAIAGIYPVTDLTTFPGIERACAAHKLTADQLADQLADRNPINRLAPLARLKVPLFHIHGDADQLVPYEANSAELARRYRALDAPVTLLTIPGGRHDMDKLWFQCQELVDFLIEHASPTTRQASP